MTREDEASNHDFRGRRGLWIGLTIFFSVMFAFRLVQWFRGGERWDHILVPAVFILLGLTEILQLKGMAQKILVVLSALLAGLALVMLFIR